ncbi:HK97 family phage prohead protease [Methyloceanibacter caenitepidi]|uniref:Gene transfer agent prohead protease n=1 Tax=Methyloceanibacter caenitepidi TaxID=1384459 RepID=A0A0A8K3H1_9HYPH|nr:HK97 family phage prohead protease [Methyloceanibacter caenitepidi]BAQ17435.1 gene transfer agent prohead protease [Methyloceanibacter caenitepidi]
MSTNHTIAERVGTPIEFKFASTASSGALDGYAAAFGNVDSYGDVIEPGAFTKSLAQIGRDPVPMFWSHNPSEVIGKWDQLSEDATGLRVQGKITLSNTAAREIFELVKDGAVRGLSIGYRTKSAERTKRGNRLLTEIQLLEVSLVALPANSSAKLISVKSAQAQDPAITERICEEILRDAGCSQRLAKAIVAQGLKSALKQRDAADVPGRIQEALTAGALNIRNITKGL